MAKQCDGGYGGPDCTPVSHTAAPTLDSLLDAAHSSVDRALVRDSPLFSPSLLLFPPSCGKGCFPPAETCEKVSTQRGSNPGLLVASATLRRSVLLAPHAVIL